MNTNPSAKTVLCFGDSNTFGQRSDDVTKGRWPVDVRWTGRLQQFLGSEYYVIEEGLSSRTTDLEYNAKPGRNGKQYLTPCLRSHHPLDLVVLMLGTNDFKDEFNRSAEDVAQAINGLIDDIKRYALAYSHDTRIILVSPIHIHDTAEHFSQLYNAKYSRASAIKSQKLTHSLKHIANTNDCAFFDAASVAEPGQDGIHLSKDSHEALAKALFAQIQSIL